MSQGDHDHVMAAAVPSQLPQLARQPHQRPRKKPCRISADGARRLFDEYMRAREDHPGLLGVLSSAYNVSQRQARRVITRLSHMEANGDPVQWMTRVPRRDSPMGDIRLSQAIVLLLTRDPTITSTTSTRALPQA